MEDIIQQMRDDHRDFDKGELNQVLGNSPFDFFEEWFSEALSKKIIEANAFVLSTVSKETKPTSRILYLKEMKEQEFIFFTNYSSQKGKDIEVNPNVSMLFFWPELQRQIRIDGVCKKTSFEVSNSYFQSRPRASQIGAWASHQSEKLKDRTVLEDRIIALTEKYPNEIPCPPHWGGYTLVPTHFEFWQGRPSRLHDRFSFEKRNDGSWSINRLNP